MPTPKIATTTSSVGPAGVRSGRRASITAGDERADRRRGAQEPEPDRPDVEDRPREDRRAARSRRRAARAKRSRPIAPSSMRVPQHEADAGDEAVPARRLGRHERARDRAAIERETATSDSVEAGRGRDVDRDGLDGEDDAAERRAGDHADLAGDAAQRERAGQQLGRDELGRQRTRTRDCRSTFATPATAASARNGQSFVAPVQRHDDEQDGDRDVQQRTRPR